MLEALRSLLIVRLRNLGDCVLMTPVLEILHRWRPGLEIVVLVERPFAAVFTNNPYLSKLEIVERAGGPLARYLRRQSAIQRLKRQTYDLVWNLHGGITSLVFTMSPQSRAQIGFEHYRHADRYSHRVPSPAQVWGKPSVHTVETQLAPIKWLGLRVDLKAIRPSIYLTTDAKRTVEAYLDRQKLVNRPFVLLQPTATLTTKQWPVERFAALAEKIMRKYPLGVVISAGPGEESVARKAIRLLPDEVALFAGRDLEQFKALVARAAFFVGNDSGPMHLAAALGRPLVAIFGSSNFHAWRPWGTDYEAVRSDLPPCIPCPGYRCYEFESPRCIERISVGEVFQAFQRIAERHPF